MNRIVQRKPVSKRLFTGLVGMPPERHQESSTEVFVSEPTPHKKRGRPPKGAQAMTPAERKRNQRMNESVNQILEENKDSKGRLHNERSGEGGRKYGMSEIERIANMKELNEDGRRVKPAGHNPSRWSDTTYDRDSDKADKVAPRVQSSDEWKQQAARENAKFARLTRYVFIVPDDGAPFCRFCMFGSDWSFTKAQNHVESEYFAYRKLADHYFMLKELEAVPPEMLAEAHRAATTHAHAALDWAHRHPKQAGIL